MLNRKQRREKAFHKRTQSEKTIVITDYLSGITLKKKLWKPRVPYPDHVMQKGIQDRPISFFKQIFIGLKSKSRAGISYTHYQSRIVPI